MPLPGAVGAHSLFACACACLRRLPTVHSALCSVERSIEIVARYLPWGAAYVFSQSSPLVPPLSFPAQTCSQRQCESWGTCRASGSVSAQATYCRRPITGTFSSRELETFGTRPGHLPRYLSAMYPAEARSDFGRWQVARARLRRLGKVRASTP